MKEFMLLIRNQNNHQDNWSPDKHLQFLKACEFYIDELKQEGNLKIAQPLVREGMMVSGVEGNWEEHRFGGSNEVIVGYYHIFADTLEEAIAIAKRNPEFDFSNTARIEVRPIKMKEEETGYVYTENN